ncbi:MAG TPA: 2OG-Fe(II) oxygenase [Pyrinomonadaceae bacterium]|nr:2OG-Fe(II) oxygenase [Pyrinomonadaceae bacterium]
MSTSWPDLFTVENFFDPPSCEALVAEIVAAESSAATVYGRGVSGAIDSGVRRTLRVSPSRETVELITRRLWSCKDAIEKHFDVSLTECEEPQFLRYREGDFFVAHQDGNTGLLRLETERRRISTVIFLSCASDVPGPNVYCGGTLVLTNRHPASDHAPFRVSAAPGTLVAFRSETTHEVTPVTHGERLSIVSWYM